MTNDELTLVLLAPALREVDPSLPNLVWDAYHGADDALLEGSRVLLRAGRAEQTRRALELLEGTRGR